MSETKNIKESKYPIIDTYIHDEFIRNFLQKTKGNDAKGAVLLVVISGILAVVGFLMKDHGGPFWLIEGFAFLWFCCGIAVAYRIRNLFDKRGILGVICPVVDAYTTYEYDREVRRRQTHRHGYTHTKRIVVEGFRCKLYIVYEYQTKTYTACIRETFISTERMTWDEEKYSCPELIGQTVYITYPYNVCDGYQAPTILFAEPDKAYLYEKAYDWYVPSPLRTKE